MAILESSSGQEIIVEPSAAAATEFVAELLKIVVCDSVDRRDGCYLALAGGTTPHALYEGLAAEPAIADLPWWKVDVFFGDERDVPHDNVESNYGMAQRTLLDFVPIPPGRVHPMPADAEDIAAGADVYERTIRQIVPAEEGGIPRFDLILLGMGGDGHTASLFPRTEAVDETDRLIVSQPVPVLGRHRMTFTFPLINAARHVILLVTGDDKAEAVVGLLSDDPQQRAEVPAARVAPTDGQLTIILDAQAARQTDLKATEL